MGLFLYFITKYPLPCLEMKGKLNIYFQYKIIWTQFVLHFTSNNTTMFQATYKAEKQIFAKL